ncbi:hypothetical protein BIW11_05830 [Tropilaelaps mercedesae]|uniref:Uncharacterized protein n=1 Tax=Tropilaelaps mercedesae TaxID=418985 RepID=A0A1V9Y0M0_9ACAR|nr:hypothetical protein BIW11_05830 [Tropilaelaps mercedesae]
MRNLIVLTIVALGSTAEIPKVPACTEGVNAGVVDNDVFRQCDGIFRNWLTANWRLKADQVKAVAAKKVENVDGSQLLVQVSPNVCMVAPITNSPRGPPMLGKVCMIEGSCPISALYKKC